MMEYCRFSSSSSSKNKKNDNSGDQIIDNMTEAFKATRISAVTASITIVDDDDDDEQSFSGGTGVEVSSAASSSVCGDLNSEDASSFSSSDAGSLLDSDDESYHSDTTRSSAFSVFCLMQQCGGFEDDCSSISTVSNFVREEEDEEAYYNCLDNSFTEATCSDDDEDENEDENDAVDKVQKSQVIQNTRATIEEAQDNRDESVVEEDDDEEVYDEDNVSTDDEYTLESDLDDEDGEVYDDEFGDEYGDDQEEEVEEEVVVEERSPRQLRRSSISGPASDLIVCETNKRVFSNINSRQSHSQQMSMFLKNIADTKKAVGIVDDSEVGGEDEIEVIEEEVIEESEVEEIEYIDETEVDEEEDDEQYVYEILPTTPKSSRPKPKQKVSSRRRLSLGLLSI